MHEFNIFMGATIAIKLALAEGVDVKVKLGAELIQRIDDMFYFYNYNRTPMRDTTLREYNELKKPLDFPTRNTVQSP